MSVKTQWIGYKTIVNEEMRRVFRIWSQTLLPQLINIALYFIIFGHVLGSRVGDFEGYPYIQFIAPGLIMMSMINSAYTATVSSFFIAKFQRSIEELLVSPLSNLVILLGFLSGGIFRGFIVGLMVSIVALLFTHLHIHSLAIIFFVALMSSMMFSLGGIINAVYAKKFDDITIIPTFVLTPLIYLGGVFYSIAFLPPVWHTISLFNPILYIVYTFRYGFLGLVTGHFLFIAMTMMVLFNILLFVVSYVMLDRGVGIRE